jgi:hypothetical protein
MSLLRSLACFVAVSALLVGAVSAQATTATLKGKAIDTDGVALPGVPVTVRTATHGSAKKTMVTDEEGRFKFQLLPPANDYFISVSYPGFAAMDVGPIDLDPGKTTIQDLTLRSAEEMTTILEIVAHGSIVDTESTKSSTTFNTEFIEGLPIIGQNYQSILTLTPGVTDTDGDGNPNVQGARETGLQFRLDGGNVTDPATGTFGQNFNIDAIEEIEVITAGASAEFGRADGGFANIITKSGGNDFEGSFRLVWRGRILDGDGAGENSDTLIVQTNPELDLQDLRPFGTLGGALKRDKLWFFASIQRIDQSIPQNLAGASITQTQHGWNNFGKVTWQVNSDNKLALQLSHDPRDFEGFFINFGTSAESDAIFSQGGNTTQIRWTSIISPTLLMETLLSNFDSGIALNPVSDLFHLTEVTKQVNRDTDPVTLQAIYPTAECSINGEASGFLPNCDPAFGPTSIYQIDAVTGTTTGPFPTRSDDSRTRKSIKSDLTYTLEDAWGEHQIKSGIEFQDEKFEDTPINNPILLDFTEPCGGCRDENGNPIQNAVQGPQILQVFSPTVLDVRAVSFNSAAYITDTWKPRPNLTLQIGARLDREDVDASGFTYFDPRDEKRRSIGIVESLCTDALRISAAGGGQPGDTAESLCDNPDRIPGTIVGQNLVYAMDEKTPEDLRRFDVNGDGVYDGGADGQAWFNPYTTFPDRLPENFEVTNLNFSPRFSVSWDPWADGRTKIFSTWGRFYDRLFLTTVDDEQGPDQINFTFLPDAGAQQFVADQLSQDVSAVSVTQVDRNLTTPFTDIFTFGVERELAPEWSARLTYTQRKGWNLLQDIDLNHILCDEFDDEFGIDPTQVCFLGIDARTGEALLSDDRFGNIDKSPNGAPDLYNVNPNFNQILRVGNFNSSAFRSLSLELNKRLHRNWQMQTSYTFARATGQAEAFAQTLGNDPSTRDDEEGFLSFDQRHRVIVIATSQLPRDVEVGGTITFESGTPFSVQAQVIDSDDKNNTVFRTFFPTRQRNDQRNDGFWGIDLKLTKRFIVGKVQAAAEISVNNLLNNDDATLSAYRTSSFNGVALVQGPQGLRRFGRFWEIGLNLNF